MSEFQKKKKFLELPRYGGGNEEFRKFIGENLRYPKAALQARIEGKVLVEYEIDDSGFVHNARVTRGLGYGCDEEALRVVNLLRFKKVKNRGLRVRVNMKTNIVFRLSKTGIIYTVVKKTEKKKPEETSVRENDKTRVYNYTINIK